MQIVSYKTDGCNIQNKKLGPYFKHKKSELGTKVKPSLIIKAFVVGFSTSIPSHGPTLVVTQQ